MYVSVHKQYKFYPFLIFVHCLDLRLTEGLDVYCNINGYYYSAFRRSTDSGSCNKLTEERVASSSEDTRKRGSERLLSSSHQKEGLS